ncbi:MAG: hypothetical protein KGL16_10990 [Acidobacteriota bacterium]|nr:hypothetical protein [Acidobacteriota bacterium]
MLAFGIALAFLVLYFVTFAVNVEPQSDFYKEVLPSYRLLDHGHFLAFVRAAPAYIGSLLLRAPLALLASAIGAGRRATYFLTALPCLVAPGMLAAWLRTGRQLTDARHGSPARSVRLRPIDLCMLTPCAVICLSLGHPEDILAATACIAATLLAQRGSGRSAGFLLGLAVINKTWALVALPLVIVLLPADRRIRGIVAVLVTAAVVLAPLTIIRNTGSGATGGAASLGASLGSGSGGIFLVPQLLWWFGRHSWVVRESHSLLVVVCWLVTGAWWWLRARGDTAPSARQALIVLALVFMLRAALDPWDNLYYFVPFLLTVLTYENPRGFPKLSWLYTILLVVIVPPAGVLHAIGDNAHAAVFAGFALATIAWFAWKAFSPPRRAPDDAYAAATTASGAAA